MKKQLTLNISEVSSSDDEEAKPKIDKEELKKYIKDSDDESTQECQLELKDKKKKLTRLNSTKIFSNKTISQKISEKNLIPESVLRKLRKKAKTLGADSLNYSRRKNYKYVVEYNDKKIHFGSINTDDYINHHDIKQREKYLNKVKKIRNKDGKLTYKLPTSPNYWAVNLIN